MEPNIRFPFTKELVELHVLLAYSLQLSVPLGQASSFQERIVYAWKVPRQCLNRVRVLGSSHLLSHVGLLEQISVLQISTLSWPKTV